MSENKNVPLSNRMPCRKSSASDAVLKPFPYIWGARCARNVVTAGRLELNQTATAN